MLLTNYMWYHFFVSINAEKVGQPYLEEFNRPFLKEVTKDCIRGKSWLEPYPTKGLCICRVGMGLHKNHNHLTQLDSKAEQ